MQTGNGRIAVFAAIAEAGNTAKITFPVRDGGSFVVQSAPGEGATVSFALPQRQVLDLVTED
ncbi:MAG: hypothetical protein EXQ93_05055 [Alphaproteobacteria bacterium]|nr:hypothetical protein [Alphaproteobacteria bacterium]